ncbi:MAG TPA: aldo/keto reductase [Candidatus Hydrogenedentes bacterium]|nr:aldo/keto reductase [Candidatus Hydrogenedentota bacterium]HPG68965.1 aldo/keto reductase [Candidatus Hydrogenedentota bacterium]
MERTRRAFLRVAAASGMAAAISGAAATRADRAPVAALPRRVLGRTKESVTIIGLGCAYAGGGIDEATTRAIIEAALDGGIRYFDAAPEYTAAEERLGPVIAPLRDECFLVTKTYAFDAEQAEKDLRGSLDRLKTDHVDLFLQHGVGLKPWEETERLLYEGGSIEFLRKAKREGLTRFIGMSVHARYDGAMTLLDETDDWDVIMPFVNYVARAQKTDERQIEGLIPAAVDQNVGVVAMKVLGGHPGLLADDYDRAFRYALSVRGVACALIGVRSVAEVNRAVKAARAFTPFTEADMAETIRLGEEKVRARSQASLMLYRHRERDSWSTRRA